MSLSILLLQLAGAVLLLLYAVHLVRTGIERVYGEALRYTLRRASKGKVVAAAGGAAMAVMLQSSTAVALLSCSFAAAGALPLATGITLL